MKCFLFDGCPGRTGVCYSCGPDGNECPVYRWFKEKVLKEQPKIVRCKECKHARMTADGEICKYCELEEDENGFLREVRHDADWFCADGEVKQDAAKG